MVDRLHTTRRTDLAGLEAMSIAHTSAASVRHVELLRVVALRHLPGGDAELETALTRHGLSGQLPRPGRFEGVDPVVAWRNPREVVLITAREEVADGVLLELRPGRHPLACAVDRSCGDMALELQGQGAGAVLSRLMDANAIPMQTHHVTHARLADIAVTVLRHADDRIWLLAEGAYASHVARWVGHAL